MNGGIKALLTTTVLAAAGCADSSVLNIRAAADPLTKAIKPGNPMVAEARGLLALGNIGLAIEAYRKVVREDPGSSEALAGLAECYDRMGRHDLSRAKYEAALAIAPKSPILLRTFATSLERQGRFAAGKALRAEAEKVESADVATRVQLAPRYSTPIQDHAARAVTERAAAPAPVPAAPPVRAATRDDAARAASVTIKVPPATPARPEPPTTLTPTTARPRAPASLAQRPRLERVSLAEVALFTSSLPHWKTELVRRTRISTTVRFVPLSPVSRHAGVRLLNAARHQGLAARTRLALNRSGWNRVTIGDAGRIRARSLVLYSPATAPLASRLAAEFGFAIAKDPRPGPLTVLLGRDAIGRARSKS